MNYSSCDHMLSVTHCRWPFLIVPFYIRPPSLLLLFSTHISHNHSQKTYPHILYVHTHTPLFSFYSRCYLSLIGLVKTKEQPWMPRWSSLGLRGNSRLHRHILRGLGHGRPLCRLKEAGYWLHGTVSGSVLNKRPGERSSQSNFETHQ